MPTFTDRIKQLREEKDVSQSEVATQIKITTRQYQRYEAGVSEPTLSVLIALARYFDVSLDYLCGLSDQRAIAPPRASTDDKKDSAAE